MCGGGGGESEVHVVVVVAIDTATLHVLLFIDIDGIVGIHVPVAIDGSVAMVVAVAGVVGSKAIAVNDAADGVTLELGHGSE